MKSSKNYLLVHLYKLKQNIQMVYKVYYLKAKSKYCLTYFYFRMLSKYYFILLLQGYKANISDLVN